MNVSAPVFLHFAQQILDGSVQVEHSQTARAAAFLARQALEELVDERCAQIGPNLDRATMTSKLIILRVLGDEPDAEAAASAWHGLSHACHHHAYELAPTAEEVRHLCRQVAGLLG
ncbi:hypothetical protein [Hoyosella subflava]|uniref:DUF4145 domain-containing protein n=1 Tax=Hoyosella subflava (strain DSM 45089 / JCM 17490 / NBRC 109087 / DQS3-9A1) TaxID=443218 RepID=F6EJ35_HOYSD|nr:hypothetical protein [Hoyosella subflava]AEF41267.1 hypothetical protein AS9A_2820 [Hoyosella subflava DQS3-9A1]